MNAIEDPVPSGSGRFGRWVGGRSGICRRGGGFAISVASAESAGVLMGGILTQRNAPGRALTALVK